MVDRLTAEQVAARSERNRKAWSKVDLRPEFRKELVKDYGEKAGIAFDKAQGRKSASSHKRPSSRKQPTPAKSKNRGIPEPSEHAIQAAVVEWWDLWAPTKGLDKRLLMAVPNGAVLAGDTKHRGMQMARLKATGLRPGCPDLLLALPHLSAKWGGLWLELKSATGRLSLAQIEMLNLLSRDFNVVTCYSYNEAVRAITAYVERALSL